MAKGNDSLTEEITLPAVTGNLYFILDLVAGMLEKNHFPRDEATRIAIAVEEIFANIAMYAYSPDVGAVKVISTITPEPLSVSIAFIDRGKPYDPLTNEVPDTTLSLDDRKVGGLGVHIVKKFMDTVTYSRKNGQNILTITKRISC
jgi:serine/threonine-protein kinase RsbW